MEIYAALAVLSVGGLIAGLLGLDLTSTIALASAVALLGVASAKELVEERVIGVRMLMAIVGFILILNGVILESLIIYVLYVIAEIMEHVVEKLAVRNLESAQRLIPRRALVERRGSVEEVEVKDLRPGDVIIVRKGEVVPVDGILLERGIFDTRYITGESIPVERGRGEVVESGYINSGAPVKVRAIKRPQDSTLQVIISRTIEMLERKSRVQRFIQRVAPYMIIGVLALFAPTYLFLGEKAVAILLAGCPSAFIILSSVDTMYTIASLARRGIVVKGGEALEAASKVRALIIDKTGTLTLGNPRPVSVHPPRGISAEEFMSIVASVAAVSLHPVSRGLAEAWRASYTVGEAKEVPGKGIRARINGSTVALGSKSFIEEVVGSGVSDGSCGTGMVVYASIDGNVGYICLGEEITEDAVRAVKKLRSMGLRLILASGDRKERVEMVARSLGIDEYYYSMKPEDKLKLVERVRKECKCGVAMIGDGVNDIEAMAASDMGIAVGNVDVIAGVADAVLIRGFRDAPQLLAAGRGYMGGILFGIGVGSLIKAVVIVLGLSGSIPLWLVALLGDDGSTLLGSMAAVVFTTVRKRLF